MSCGVNIFTYGHASHADSAAISLKLQGGPFSQAEAKDFEAIPYYKDALRLR